jgi:hypothetical protein
MKMHIQNPSNRIPIYKPPANNAKNNNKSQMPRLAISGAMIGRIQFSKSGCSSCGH